MARFSALQRAEIAEMDLERHFVNLLLLRFSALQRAEIAEMPPVASPRRASAGFSALQRAEIAEMKHLTAPHCVWCCVSVLFNEPKLLKSKDECVVFFCFCGFSALQRAEIAEISY